MLDVNIFFGQVALRFSACQWSVATVQRSLRAICAQKYVEIPKSTQAKKEKCRPLQTAAVSHHSEMFTLEGENCKCAEETHELLAQIGSIEKWSFE